MSFRPQTIFSCATIRFRASTAERERRYARFAFAGPIFSASAVSGRSISHCSRAVEATVEPVSGGRRSSTATVWSRLSSWAMKAPLIPAPTMATSTEIAAFNGRTGTPSPGLSAQRDRPVRRFFLIVAPVMSSPLEAER